MSRRRSRPRGCRPPPAAPLGDFRLDLWRHLKTWAGVPDRTRNVWLAYGQRDPFSTAMPQLVPLLPSGQVLVREGGHTWTVWTPAAAEMLRAADRRRAAALGQRSP